MKINKILNQRGARASNAGDDFHEWWALKHVLQLLDNSNTLCAVTVEEPHPHDENQQTPETWEGADCTLYYGGEEANQAEKVIIEQLKYSVADPMKPWSIERVTYSKPGKKNSIIYKLAQAFKGIHDANPDLVKNNQLSIRFVSNQPVKVNLKRALTDKESQDYQKLLTASGLTSALSEPFIQALDFSCCGEKSRFDLEKEQILTVSKLLEGNADQTVSYLKNEIHKMFLPEQKGTPITETLVLSWLGVYESKTLFPCPPKFEEALYSSIPRQISKDIIEILKQGTSRICIEGEAGFGKTTVLQEIKKLLPPHSEMIIFDCYGDGEYLNSDMYRHRPTEVYLQLINQLALDLKTPYFVVKNSDHDYPKIFSTRLNDAAQIISKKSQNALLVIAIDAADNSIIAAEQCSEQERSFIHEFVKIGSLNNNIRIIITTRAGNRHKLKLPDCYVIKQMEGFTLDETNKHVRKIWPNSPQKWIDELHQLSNQNPRVQNYAFEYAKPYSLEKAIEYLRPNGKTLDQIFRQRFQETLSQDGEEPVIRNLCSMLAELPRPIPIKVLADISKLNVPRIRDICSNLPGILLTKETISFADEDFENFVRTEGHRYLEEAQKKIAEYFFQARNVCEYSAIYLVNALFRCEDYEKIIQIVTRECEPKVIRDLILKDEIKRQRLRFAMKVCRLSGDVGQGLMTLFSGAAALKTQTAVQNALIENPDLAVMFSYETIRRTILNNPNEPQFHGKLLCHLMRQAAQENDFVLVRRQQNMFHNWLERKKKNSHEKKKRDSIIENWPIDEVDIAAYLEAQLRAGDSLDYKWRSHEPSDFCLALVLLHNLILLQNPNLIDAFFQEVPKLWRLLLRVPLVLSDEEIDILNFEKPGQYRLCQKLISSDYVDQLGQNEAIIKIYELILTGCEFIIARNKNNKMARRILELFITEHWRRRDKLFLFNISKIDLSLRAFTLLERISGRTPTLESYWIAPPIPTGNLSKQELLNFKRDDEHKKKELLDSIGLTIEIYDRRAQVLLGLIPLKDIETQLASALQTFRNKKNYLSSYDHQKISAQLACLMAKLVVLKDVDAQLVWRLTTSVFERWPCVHIEAQQQILTELSLIPSLQETILEDIYARETAVMEEKISSASIVKYLLELARLLMPLHQDEAQAVFETAISVANQIDVDIQLEIALFSPLAQKAAKAPMEFERKRPLAYQIAQVVTKASVYLQEYDGFPWQDVSTAIASLDLPQALAAVGFWEDSGLIQRKEILSSIIHIGLENQEMHSAQAMALLHFYDHPDIALLQKIAKYTDSSISNKLAEEIAREELKRFCPSGRTEVAQIVRSLSSSTENGFLSDQLKKVITFNQEHSPFQEKNNTNENNEQQIAKAFGAVNWLQYDLATISEVNACLNDIKTKTKNLFIKESDILFEVSKHVKSQDEIKFLTLLYSKELNIISDNSSGSALIKCLNNWKKSLRIRKWIKEELPKVLKNNLDIFSKGLAYTLSTLPELLGFLELSSNEIVDLLLEGIEKKADYFNAATIYALIDILIQYISPQLAQRIIQLHADDLFKRISPVQSQLWTLENLPADTTSSLARLFYALMSDIDLSSRWRSAHAVRCLARLNDIDTIEQLIKLYDMVHEAHYRVDNAPFYWISARLWLFMTLDKIAEESPAAILKHSQALFAFATDDNFPHIIIRHFAKSTVKKLIKYDHSILQSTQLEALENLNISVFPREKPSDTVQRYHGLHEVNIEERFQFDRLDTLPYWYSNAARIFSNVDFEQFLLRAEHWIIDTWGDTKHIQKDIRHDRIQRYGYGVSMHRHGTKPKIERYHTYLEWHAMCCVIGDFLKTHPISKSQYEDHGDVFEGWLHDNILSLSSLWLADLRSPKPLWQDFWFMPKLTLEQNINDLSNEVFLKKIGLSQSDDSLVINGYSRTQRENFIISVQISSALVAPETAAALMRALQTADDSYDYRLPPVGDGLLEINAPPYQLKGWLTDEQLDLGIEKYDDYRKGVRAIKSCPSLETMTVLNLEFIFQEHPIWIEKDSQTPVFKYIAWSDNIEMENEKKRFHHSLVFSDGWHLEITRHGLQTFLKKMKFDLIAEVEIIYEENGYEYSRGYQNSKERARFTRILLLKRDGDIQITEGCIGTWLLSS